MDANLITLGDKIELIKTWKNESKKEKHYFCKVLDYGEKDQLLLSMPIENNHVVPLEIDDSYTMCIYTKNGLYQCKIIIVDRYREQNLFLMVVQMVSDIERFVRREYYRLSCIMDITYRVFSVEEKECLKRLHNQNYNNKVEQEQLLQQLQAFKIQEIPAIATDISGGGIRFNSQLQHQKGDILFINLELPILKIIKTHELKACVLGSMRLQNRPGMFENRVEFVDIATEQRENIIRYIFEEERKRRRKEKGLD